VPHRVDFEFSVETLMGPHQSKCDNKQWDKVLELRAILEEYNKALLRFSEVTTLEAANKSDLNNLREWLRRKDGGHNFLRGYEADTWDKFNEKDLVSLTARYRNKDVLSKWIDIYIIPLCHRLWGDRLGKRVKLCEENASSMTLTSLYYYDDSTVRVFVNTLSTILASLLPTVSIFVLYFVHSPLARLGSIVLFTILFSVVLAVIAKARRVDCFAATTAFAAVLVVFVGSTTKAT